MEKLEDNFLYLVVLGGRAKKANVELHDVRWVVGSKIEDTYDTLKNDWFGSSKGLHIDSYKKIQYIDGHKINLKNVENHKIGKKELVKKNNSKKCLWFVNIGGYNPNSCFSCIEDGLYPPILTNHKFFFGIIFFTNCFFPILYLSTFIKLILWPSIYCIFL